MASRDEIKKKEDGQTAGGQERENAGGGSLVVGLGLGKGGGMGSGWLGVSPTPGEGKLGTGRAQNRGPQALAEQIVESGDRTRRQKAGSNSIPLGHAGQVLPFTFRIPRDKTEQG